MFKKIKTKYNNIKDTNEFFIFEICFFMSIIYIVNGLNFDLFVDGAFHTRRFYDIFLSVKDGYFLSFIAEDLLYGYGYPTLGFYPYLLILPFALLQFIFPLNFCYLLYNMFIRFLAGFSAYIFAKEITKNKDKQFVFTIVYLIIFPNIYYLYYVSNLGMISAWAIIPFVFTAFLKMLRRHKWGVLFLSSSMILLSYTHIISTVLVAMVLVGLFFVNIKEIIKNKKIILDIFISALITIVSCSFVIFPVLEQLLNNSFHNVVNDYNILNGIKEPWDIVVSIIVFGLILFINLKKKDKRTLYLSFSIILLISATNIFPWFLCKDFLTLIQFGYRLWLFIGFTVGLCVISCDDEKIKKKVADVKLYAFGVVFLMMVALSSHTFLIDNGYMEERVVDSNIYIGSGEYVPENFLEDNNLLYFEKDDVECQNLDVFDRDFVMSLNEGISYEIIDKDTIRFNNNTNDTIIVPKLYYKGYDVFINGNEVECSCGKYGLIEIDAKEIQDGDIYINYGGTITQHVSKYISLVSLGLLSGVWIHYFRKRFWRKL